jgi:hypothetical protein
MENQRKHMKRFREMDERMSESFSKMAVRIS